MRVCRAMLGRADADDAWAETFLAALKAYPSLRPDSNVRAWLVTIAHRKAIDQTRSRARRPLPVDDLPETPSIDRRPGRSRHRVVGSAPGAAVQAARRSRLPPPGRNAVRRGRRPAGFQRGRGTTQRGGWNRQPAQELLEGIATMTNTNDSTDQQVIDDLFAALTDRRHRATASQPARRRGRTRRRARRLVPHDRQPGRVVAAGGHTGGIGEGRVRSRGPRRGPHPTGHRDQPADPARTAPTRRGGGAVGRVLQRSPSDVRRADRSATRARFPPDRAHPPARHRLRRDRQLRDGRRGVGEPGRRPRRRRARAPTTRCRSSCRAIESCAATARSASTSAAPRPSRLCWRWRRSHERDLDREPRQQPSASASTGSTGRRSRPPSTTSGARSRTPC